MEFYFHRAALPERYARTRASASAAALAPASREGPPSSPAEINGFRSCHTSEDYLRSIKKLKRQNIFTYFYILQDLLCSISNLEFQCSTAFTALTIIFACETSGRLWVGVSQVKLKFHGYSRAVEHRSHFARLTMAAQIVAMLCMLM